MLGLSGQLLDYFLPLIFVAEDARALKELRLHHNVVCRAVSVPQLGLALAIVNLLCQLLLLLLTSGVAPHHVLTRVDEEMEA